MHRASLLALALLSPLALLTPLAAHAEGTATLSNTQALRAGTVLYVDIVDAATETISWTGVGTVTVTAPDLVSSVATLSSGQSTGSLSGYGNGAYRVTVNSSQVVFTNWDVAVNNQTDSDGRLYSYDWAFNAGAFSQDRAANASFYALVPGGATGTDAVIELLLDGLAGYVYNINANSVGVQGSNGGRSVSQSGNSVTPDYPIYLNPPTIASYNAQHPDIYALSFVGGTSTDVLGSPMEPCTQLVPGSTTGFFQFSTNTTGSYHLQCDINGDGNYDMTSGNDLLLIGETTVGLNTVEWNGMHMGEPIAIGNYNCRVRVTMGEFHYVGSDIETSYPGMRLYEVHNNGDRSPLTMYWNDSSVQGNAILMNNSQYGLMTAGESGMFSDPYGSTAVANTNARAWGNFSSGGKGNQAFLDTYTWLDSETSSAVVVTAVDPLVDTDGDGAGDFEEECVFGSDPNDIDTDDDETNDGDQYGGGASSGGGNGLESNGRLASALARRAIQRSRMSTMPQLRLGRVSHLSELAPPPGTLGASTVEVSPTDLVGLTNASEVYSLDYLAEDGERLGGVLLIETVGEVYEHSKLVCDRAAGGRLSDLSTMRLGDHDILRATASNPQSGVVDHLMVFSLQEQAEDSVSLSSYWLTSHYPQPEEGQPVVRVQAWSKVPGGETRLARAVLAKAEALYGRLGAPGDEALLEDEAIDAGQVPQRTTRDTSLPALVMLEGQVLGGSLSLDVETLADDGEFSLRLITLDENARDESVEERPLALNASNQRVELDVGRALDVTVELLHDGEVEDQLWLSDGAWAPYDDGLWGGSTSATFSRNECTPHHPDADATEATDGALVLAGCAHTSATVVEDAGFAGVARHLARPLSASEYETVRMHVTSERAMKACVHDEQGVSYCTDVDAAPLGRWIYIPMARLVSDHEEAGAPGSIQLVTVTVEHAGDALLEVSGLAFSDQSYDSEVTPPAEAGCACSVHSEDYGTTSAGMLALLMLLRRRRRSGPRG